MMARAEHEDTCAAKPLRAFLGRKADQVTRVAVEQRVPNSHRIRWILPGEDILGNLNTGRINIELDYNGTIKNVSCY